MEHRTHDQVAQVARLHQVLGLAEPMFRKERLQCWMTLLQAEPQRKLWALYQTEYQPLLVRDSLGSEETAITVAFADPVLRAQGLVGDTYGDAKDFFGLSDVQLHHIICGYHLGRTISARTAARRVGDLLPWSMRAGVLQRVARALTGWPEPARSPQ